MGAADNLAKLPQADAEAVARRTAWQRSARPNQLLPEANKNGEVWDTAIWLAGRFFGKTRILSEQAWWPCYRYPGFIWHALAPTIGDLRRVVFEGPSGILACMPRELIADYNRSLHELVLTNGSKILGFSMTEEADRLRGPQCHAMSADEIAAADRPAGNLEVAYKVASLGCRLPHPDGVSPARRYLATTPRPILFLRNLIKRPKTLVVRGTSYENLANVATSIRDELLSLEGTAFGRQEIYGEILDNSENAIFQRKWYRLWPNGKKLPEFNYILASLDPAVSERDYDAKRQVRDPSGCGIFGIFNTKQCFTEAELKRMGVRSKYAAVLCDYWTDYLGFPELIEELRKVYRTKYGSPGRRPDIMLIEAEKTGISIRQTLMQYGVPTWPSQTRGQSKTMRAHAASPLLLQGMLFVPESGRPDRIGQFRDWAEPLVDQMCSFAGEGSVEHDEAVDVVTQAMLHLMEAGHFHAEPISRELPDPDEKKDLEQKRAMQQYREERAGKGNPYAQ